MSANPPSRDIPADPPREGDLWSFARYCIQSAIASERLAEADSSEQQSALMDELARMLEAADFGPAKRLRELSGQPGALPTASPAEEDVYLAEVERVSGLLVGFDGHTSHQSISSHVAALLTELTSLRGQLTEAQADRADAKTNAALLKELGGYADVLRGRMASLSLCDDCFAAGLIRSEGAAPETTGD